MALDDTPNKLESVWIQRNTENQFYEQTNISGSDLIIYHSSSGELMADKISVWAAKYGIGGGDGSTLRVDINDTTSDYLRNKLVAGTNISFSINNPGGNETLRVDAVVLRSDQSTLATSSLVASSSLIASGSLPNLLAPSVLSQLVTHVAGDSNFYTPTGILVEATSGVIYATASQAISASISTLAVNPFVDLNHGAGLYPLVFTIASTGYDPLFADPDVLNYNPSTGILQAIGFSGSFSGSLNGTASQALSASYADHAIMAVSSSWASSSISASYLSGGTNSYFTVWNNETLSSTSSIRQISSSIVEISSSIYPVSDNVWNLGSIVRKWANGFITSISSSFSYAQTIYTQYIYGSTSGGNLTIQSSVPGGGVIFINPNGDPVVVGTYLTGTYMAGNNGSITVGGNAFFAGGSVLVGSKPLLEISTSYSDIMVLNIPMNETIYTKTTLHGKWNGGGSVGYMCECFFQRGDDTKYSQPGVILNQCNNGSSNKYVTAQILDSALTASNGILKLQFQTNNDYILSGSRVLFEVRGNFNSVV